MSTSTTTPNMGLTNPTPGQEPGPTYATDISNDLVTIDAHDHSSGKGVPVTPAGLSISSDLPFLGNNASQLRAARFTSQTGVLSGSGDTSEVYVVNGNLYFNNASGQAVQVTNGTIVNTTVTGSTTLAEKTISGTYNVLSSDTFIVLLCQSNVTAITVNLPTANSVPPGRWYLIKDNQGSAAGHNITIAVTSLGDTIDNGAAGGDIILDYNNAAVILVSDGNSNWATLASNRTVYDASKTAAPKLVALTSGSVLSSGASAILANTGSAIASAVPGGIALGGGTQDWVRYTQARTHRVKQPIEPYNLTLGWSYTLAPPAAFTIANSGSQMACKLPVHDGATLSEVTVFFAVAASHSGVPGSLPTLYVTCAGLTTGSAVSELSLTSSNNPMSFPNPGSGAAYFSGGNLQSFTFRPDQNNVIDLSKHSYSFYLQDESGANSHVNNAFYAVECLFTNITSSFFQ